MFDRGDDINGYMVEGDQLNTGGGRSSAFKVSKKVKLAKKSFFLKIPHRPRVPESGSYAVIERKKQEFDAFYKRQVEYFEVIMDAQQGCKQLNQLRDYFRLGGMFVAVYDFLDLISRDALERQGIASFPLNARLGLLEDCTKALVSLHEHGLVHGDVKFENLGIRQSNNRTLNAVLVDYDNGYRVGKPDTRDNFVLDDAYAAPEVLDYVGSQPGGDPDTLGVAADVYSFAVLATEILTGEGPRRDHPLLPDEVVGGTAPSPLIDLVGQALSPDPSLRPPIESFLEPLFQRDRQGLGGGLPKQFRPPSRMAPPPKAPLITQEGDESEPTPLLKRVTNLFTLSSGDDEAQRSGPTRPKLTED